jgi:hypothetical protein
MPDKDLGFIIVILRSWRVRQHVIENACNNNYKRDDSNGEGY